MNSAVAPSRSVQAHVAGMIFVEHLQQGILETKILFKFAKFGPWLPKFKNTKIHHRAIFIQLDSYAHKIGRKN